MALAKPNQITVPFASSGVKNTIPETATGSNLASMQEGFPTVTMTDVDQGGMPPQGQDMNGILFDVTKAIQYQQAGGLFPFDATFASKIDGYPIGALLTSADGTKIFQNMIDGNQSDPENGGQNWNEILTSTAIAGKQDALNAAQLAAVNSGITAAKVAEYDGYATGKQDTLTFDNTPTEGSLNPVTSDGIATALSLKQDNMTVDAVPTSGSTNPVQSGGVYDAIAAKDSLPDQTGHSGEFLSTDGTDASWESIPLCNPEPASYFDDIVFPDPSNPIDPYSVRVLPQTLADSQKEQARENIGAFSVNDGITATGSTTARTLANRFADVINVRDFGAKGDGVTDDYSAFYAAQQNFQTKGIYPFIPPGDYYLSAKVPGIFCYVTGVTLDPKKCYAVKITNPRDILNDNNIAFGQPTIFRWAFRFTDSAKKADFIAKAQELKAYCANNNFTYGNWNTVPPSGTQIDCSTFIAWCLYEIGYTELANSNPQNQLIDSDGTFQAWFRSKTADFTEVLNIRNLEQGDIVFTGAISDFSYATHVYMFWTYNTGYGIAASTIGETGDVQHPLTALYADGAFLSGLTRSIPPNNAAGITVKLNENLESYRQLYTFENADISNASIFGGLENRGSASSTYTGIFNRKGQVDARAAVGFESSDTANGRFTFYPDGSTPMVTFRGNVCQFRGFVQPMVDNSWSCGSSSLKWTAVYAVNGTIQTSDERKKTSIDVIPDAVLDAWGDVNWSQFQFCDAVKEKGTAARLHSGLIAQHIDSVFKSHGLDASRYGLLCYDKWDAQEEVWETQEIEHPPLYDSATGEVIEPAWIETVKVKVQEGREAGDLYSVRYDEALSMEAAYQRREVSRLKERLSALEKRI